MVRTADLRIRRAHLKQSLVVTFMIGVATLIIAALLFGAALFANVVPPFQQQFPLLGSTTLEIGVVSGCPPTMPSMACLHVQNRFPPVFKIIYRPTGAAWTLVSITLPRR